MLKLVPLRLAGAARGNFLSDMKIFYTFLTLVTVLLVSACTYSMQMQRQAACSRTVVLDIGHYYHPERGGQGARTPDDRYGSIEECEFWYQYAIEVKRVVEAAGYTCLVCNRGDTPNDPQLAQAARKAGVHQVKTPIPTAVYRSSHHPERMAVGILSADYALSQKPACVVFLHHNSYSDDWQVWNKGAFYCNKAGIPLSETMMRVMNEDLLNHGLPNGGIPCGSILRDDGRRGGGDWLNTCNDSYVPAVLTEVAFLSNPEHAQFLSQPENAKRYARTIGKGIVEYLNNR